MMLQTSPEGAAAALRARAERPDYTDLLARTSVPALVVVGRGCPIGSLAAELADVDEAARVALVGGFAQWESAIRDGLAAMRERGELRDDADPDWLALAILTALQGGLLLTQTRRDITPLQVGLDAAIGYVRTFAA